MPLATINAGPTALRFITGTGATSRGTLGSNALPFGAPSITVTGIATALARCRTSVAATTALTAAETDFDAASLPQCSLPPPSFGMVIRSTTTAATRSTAMAASITAVTAHIAFEEAPIDIYSTDQFMDALRSEEVFEPVAFDDINLSGTPLPIDYGSEEDMNNLTEYVLDVASRNSEEENKPIKFDVPENELRETGASGWESYDPDHCGSFDDRWS
ncbi:hypothetical protein BBJ28_00006601 [Nothophytophthora sp. Chile5]|nr:hypothetical protein BBJ28_00006601 [Nothophytophthora sp. Chile5]